MAPVFLILGIINIFIISSYGVEIPEDPINIKTRTENDIPIEDRNLGISREKGHFPYNRLKKRFASNYYPTIITGNSNNGNWNSRNNRISHNITKNNNNATWNYGRNVTSGYPKPLATRRYGNLNNTKPGYVNNYTSPHYPSAYSPKPGYNTKPGYTPYPDINKGYSAYTSTTPRGNYYNRSTIPGYRPQPGNNIQPGYKPYPDTNKGQFVFTNTTPKVNNFNRTQIPGYYINNNVPVTLKPGNVTIDNGNATAVCGRCRYGIKRNNSTITKQEFTMNACTIICNDCPEGTTRVGMQCVPNINLDDEE